VVAGVAAQEHEGVIDADVAVFGDNALRLFYYDARFEGALKLGEDDVSLAQGAFVQDADRGDVGKRLGDLLVLRTERL